MKPMKTAGILLVVLMVLGGIATWDEWQTEKEEKAKEETNRLLTIAVKDITTIKYRKQLEDEPVVELTLEKKGDSWRLVSPVVAKADAAAIANWLKSFGDYNYDRLVSKGDNEFAKYGLEASNAERTIEFTTVDGTTETVYVGDESAVGYKSYGRTSNTDGVFVGSRHLRIFTNKTVFDFRDKQVVDFNVDDLVSFTFERREKETIRLIKDADKWRLKVPIEDNADGDEVREFAMAMTEVRAAAFYEPPSDDLQLLFGDPDYRVTMEDSTGHQSSMLITNHGGKLVGAFNPQTLAFELPDNMRAALSRKLLDFRIRRVVPIDANTVTKVEVDGDTYQRIDGRWYTSEIANKFDEQGRFQGEGTPPEANHLQALVVDMEFAKTDDFFALDGAEAKGLSDAPQHRIRVHNQDGQVVSIELYNDGDNPRYWVKIDGAKHLYRIHSKEFEAMKPLDTGLMDQADKGEDDTAW